MSFKFSCKSNQVLKSAKKLFFVNSRDYRLLFIGPPGVGKGTFAKIIGPQLHAQVIDTGGLLRKITKDEESSDIKNYSFHKNNNSFSSFSQHSFNCHPINMKHNHQSINHTHTNACDDSSNCISSETKKLIQTYMTKGELIPDNILLPIMLSHLKSLKSSIILDGFPRTLSQIKWLHDHNFHFNLAIRFHLPDHILIAKMLGRRVCQDCDNTYNVANVDEMNNEKLGIQLPLLKPKNPNKCDKCDGNLVCRSEDTINTLQNRMDIYHQQTEPIVQFLNNSYPDLLMNFNIKKGVEDSNSLLSQIKQKLLNSK